MDTLDDTLLVTAAGYKRLEQELLELIAGRRVMSERVRDARFDGDIADNLALVELLEEQAQLESRIGSVSEKLAVAQVASPPADGRAGVGSAVRVRHLDSGAVAEYELVGTISPVSDIGASRLGHRSAARCSAIVPARASKSPRRAAR